MEGRDMTAGRSESDRKWEPNEAIVLAQQPRRLRRLSVLLADRARVGLLFVSFFLLLLLFLTFLRFVLIFLSSFNIFPAKKRDPKVIDIQLMDF